MTSDMRTSSRIALVVAGCVAAAIATGNARAPAAQQETMRVRGQVLAEGGGPLAGAQISTDAIRGPMAAQFVAQRHFTTRTGKNGEWALLGLTRGLWILEVTAPDHAPHVVVVPIAMMLRPEPAAWDTSLALLPMSMVAPGGGTGGQLQHVLDAIDRVRAGDKFGARAALQKLTESNLDAAAMCAAGDVALLLREPGLARRLFEIAATTNPKWYRPRIGLASAAMMALDVDGAVNGYAGARTAIDNKRLERMLSLAIRDLQQIRSVGGDGRVGVPSSGGSD